MNLKNLNDDQLIERIEQLVRDERETITKVLWHLREIESRRLYAFLGYSSLFDYCIRKLNYSEGAAQRRISSMRLLKELPDIEEKLNSGALNLSTVALAQQYFRSHEKNRKSDQKEIAYSENDKKTLLKSFEHKSRREVEKELVKLSPEFIPSEREKMLTDDKTEIRFIADTALLTKLNKLKSLTSHRNSNPSYSELFELLADLALKKLDPDLQKKGNIRGNSQSNSMTTETRNLAETTILPPPAAVITSARRFIWKRDHGKCTYIDQRTGTKCESRHRIQLDHFHPKAQGGTNEPENLRLLCQAHNQSEAIRKVGKEKMQRYLK